MTDKLPKFGTVPGNRGTKPSEGAVDKRALRLAEITTEMQAAAIQSGSKFEADLDHLYTALRYGVDMPASVADGHIASMRRAQRLLADATTASLIGGASNSAIQQMTESALDAISGVHAAILAASQESAAEKRYRIRSEMTALVDQIADIIVRESVLEASEDDSSTESKPELVGPPIDGRAPARRRSPARRASAQEVEALTTTLEAHAHFSERTGEDQYGLLSQLLDAIKQRTRTLDSRQAAYTLARYAGYALVGTAILGGSLWAYNAALNSVTAHASINAATETLRGLSFSQEQLAELAASAYEHAQYLNQTVTSNMARLLTQQNLMQAILDEPDTSAATVEASKNVLSSLLVRGIDSLSTAYQRLSPEVLARFANPAAVQASSGYAVSMMQNWLAVVRGSTDMDTIREVVLQMQTSTEATSGIAAGALETSMALAQGAVAPLMENLATMNATIASISELVVRQAETLETAKAAVVSTMSLSPLTTALSNKIGETIGLGASGVATIFSSAVIQPIAAAEQLLGGANKAILAMRAAPLSTLPLEFGKSLGEFTSHLMAGIASGHLTKVATGVKVVADVVAKYPDAVRYRYLAAEAAARDADNWKSAAYYNSKSAFWQAVSFIYDTISVWITGSTAVASVASLGDFLTKVSPITILSATTCFYTVSRYALTEIPIATTFILIAASILVALIGQIRSPWITSLGRHMPVLFAMGKYVLTYFIYFYLAMQLFGPASWSMSTSVPTDPITASAAMQNATLANLEQTTASVREAIHSVANLSTSFVSNISVSNALGNIFASAAAAENTL